MNWLKQASVNVPTEIDSSPNAFGIASETFAQFRYTRGNSIHGKDSVPTCVSRLVSARGPANIGNFIAPIIVYSFKRPSLFAFTGIGKKVFKLRPSLTESYSSFAVACGSSVPWVTSVFHIHPDTINSSLGHSMCLVSFGRNFSVQTSTGLSMSRPKMAVRYCDFSSAVAKTFTFSRSCSKNVSSDKKSCEAVSDDVEFSRHGIGSFNVVFSGGRWVQPTPAAIMT
jgi:hypothetical protein